MVHDKVEEFCKARNEAFLDDTNLDATFDDISTGKPLPLDNECMNFSNPAPAITPNDFATQRAIATPFTQTAAQSCDVNALAVAQMRADMMELAKSLKDMK